MSAMSCETETPRGLDAARDQRGRPDQRDVRAAGQQQREVRAGHARVQHVADDRDVHAFDAPERGAHRVQVEQALRRVLVRAVAGVDDRGARVARGERGGSDLRVADDDDVGAVGVERQQRVLERLALLHRRAARLERDRVRREPLGRELERRRRPRRGLEEDAQHGAAAQRRQLLDLALRDRLEARGELEQALDRRRGRDPRSRAGDGCRARPSPPARERRAHAAPRSSTTSSAASSSPRCTRTRSLRDVGRFLPTTSARIGSSRCPRSQSTARRTRAGRP